MHFSYFGTFFFVSKGYSLGGVLWDPWFYNEPKNLAFKTTDMANNSRLLVHNLSFLTDMQDF